MRRIDFRSDTMTMPTPAMRDAMRDAEVGDDVCGEDPTVNRLEARAAEMTGKEAALFVPSGTFGNQCAIRAHTRHGDEIVVCEAAHVIEHEAGAAAALSGVQTRTISPENGEYITAAEIEPRLRLVGDIHHPNTGLIILENATSLGTVMPIDEMRLVKRLAESHRIPVHVDGARLFNAALSLGVSAVEVAAEADSVTFCLSKGLGAPVGSLLCGTVDFIARARRIRKIMGGGMRQAGVLAAAGLLALSEGVARLGEDHENARLLARLLADIPGVVVHPGRIHTNMVFCRLNRPGKEEGGLVAFLREQGILTYEPGPWGLRFVTSREVTAGDVKALSLAVSQYLR